MVVLTSYHHLRKQILVKAYELHFSADNLKGVDSRVRGDPFGCRRKLSQPEMFRP